MRFDVVFERLRLPRLMHTRKKRLVLEKKRLVQKKKKRRSPSNASEMEPPGSRDADKSTEHATSQPARGVLTRRSTTLDELFCQLKIISQLRQHERVKTRGDVIAVEPHSYWQPVWRWLAGENRNHNVAHIGTIVDNAMDHIEQCVRASRDGSALSLLNRFDRQLGHAAEGLANLRCTYDRCSVTKARIDVFVEKITDARDLIAAHTTSASGSNATTGRRDTTAGQAFNTKTQHDAEKK